MSIIAAIQEHANGKDVTSPIAIGYTITLGTVFPGLWISSHRCAPASVPRNAYTALLMLRRKAKPSLAQPVEFVVSVKTHLADARVRRLDTSSVIVVAVREKTAKTTVADKHKLERSILGCTHL